MNPFDGLNLFWGDLHCHVRERRRDPFSSGPLCATGPGTLDEVYAWGRNAAGLDFAAVTDHDVHLNADEWGETAAAARRNSEPGRFVAFVGYEWSHVPGGPSAAFGHRNVIYRRLSGPLPLLPCNDPRSDTAPKLWEALRRVLPDADVVVIPHHPARGAGGVWWNFAAHDPDLERLVEVYSLWGSSEKPGPPYEIRYLAEHSPTGSGEAPGHFVQDALAAGLRFGLTAGSESHDGRPGSPRFHGPYRCGGDVCYRGGIQGAWAKALDRDALFDAFRRRLCYGTTGKKIVVTFSVNGTPMGGEAPPAAERRVQVYVRGTAPIRSVTVVRNNADVRVETAREVEIEVEWCDVRSADDADYYYVRILQSDGHMAWSSPVWVG